MGNLTLSNEQLLSLPQGPFRKEALQTNWPQTKNAQGVWRWQGGHKQCSEGLKTRSGMFKVTKNMFNHVLFDNQPLKWFWQMFMQSDSTRLLVNAETKMEATLCTTIDLRTTIDLLPTCKETIYIYRKPVVQDQVNKKQFKGAGNVLMEGKGFLVASSNFCSVNKPPI